MMAATGAWTVHVKAPNGATARFVFDTDKSEDPFGEMTRQFGDLVCRMRLNGIDAPELPGHCRAGRHCAPGDPFASKANMARMVTGKRVHWADLGKDKYGRTIAEVKVGRVDVQCAQLKGGFAIYKPRWDNQKLVARTCG